MIKNNIYIDDHLPVILEEYEKMSHKELEQSCEKMKKETLKENDYNNKNNRVRKLPKKMRYYTILENGWRLETNIPWNQIKVEK
jgi:hypothetical protein